MRRPLILAPLLAALMLVTALASGLSHGQMLRADALAWLDICADEEKAHAPCLDCSLGAGMTAGEAGLSDRAAKAERLPTGADLVAGRSPCVGGGARTPPGWV